jgi:hypothetical protein
MLSLELARTIHEDRQRGIEARSRVIGLIRDLPSPRGIAIASGVAAGTAPRRRAGLTTSDGRG